MALDDYTDYGIDNGVLIIASDYEPNHSTITYWIDTTLDPNGKIIKYYDKGTNTWIRLLSDTTGGGGSGGDNPDLDELWRIVNEQQETVIILQDKYYLLLQKMRVYTEDLLNTNQYTAALAKQVIDNTSKINALLGNDLTDIIDQLQSEIRDLQSTPGIPTKIDPDLDDLQDAGTFKILQNNADGSVTIYTLMQTVQTVRDNKEAYIQLRMGYPSTITGIERRTYNLDVIDGWSKWVEIGEHDEPIVPAAPDIYFRYATKPDYSDFLTATSEDALYMGIQKNNYGYEVQEVGEYKWSRIKGTQGLQGPQGLQGTQGLRGQTPNHTFTLYKKVKKGVLIDIPSTDRVQFTDINVGVNSAVQGWSRVLDTDIADDEVIYSTVGYADTVLDKVTRYQTKPVKVNAFDGRDMTEMWDFKYKATAQANIVPTISNTASKTQLLREGWANEALVDNTSKFVWMTKGKLDTASTVDNMIVSWSRPVLMNREGEPGVQGAVIRMVGEFTNTPKKDAKGEDLYYQSGNNMWASSVEGIPFDNSKFIDVVVLIEGGLYYYYRCNKAILIADAPHPKSEENMVEEVWTAFEQYQALATNVLLADNAFLRCVQGGQMIIQGSDEADPLSNKGWLMTAGSIRHFDRLDMAESIDVYKYLNIDLDETGNVFFGKTYTELELPLKDKETEIQEGIDGNGYYIVNAFFTDGSGHIGRLVKGYTQGCVGYSDATSALSWSSSERKVAIMDYLVTFKIGDSSEWSGGGKNNSIYFKTEDFQLNKSLFYKNSFYPQCVTANFDSEATPVRKGVDSPRIGTVFGFTYRDDRFGGPYFKSEEESWDYYNGVTIEMYKQNQKSLIDGWDTITWQDNGSPEIRYGTYLTMFNPGYTIGLRNLYGTNIPGIQMFCGYEEIDRKVGSSTTTYYYPTSSIKMFSDIDYNYTQWSIYQNPTPIVEINCLVSSAGAEFGTIILRNPSSNIRVPRVVCDALEPNSADEIQVNADLRIAPESFLHIEEGSLWVNNKQVFVDSNGFLKIPV